MNKENALKLWKNIQEAGDKLAKKEINQMVNFYDFC